jgi:hypothetical protein
LKPMEELHKLNIIRNRLQQINKPSTKTIQVCQSFILFFFSFPLFLLCFCSVFCSVFGL